MAHYNVPQITLYYNIMGDQQSPSSDRIHVLAGCITPKCMTQNAIQHFGQYIKSIGISYILFSIHKFKRVPFRSAI